MGRYLLGILLLLKYCICDDVVNFDGDIKDFVVGNSKLFVLTDHRLHQMRHDLNEEKRKDITDAPHHNRVNILVPFEANGTLITCGTFKYGYCEVLDINDITNSIYYESDILVGPQQNEKSVAFIAGSYLLVGKKEDDAKAQDARYSVASLWNTLQSQPGGIFSRTAEGSDAIIQSTVRDVEFVDGFQRVSPSESYLFLNAKTDSERKVLVLWMNSSKVKKIDIIKSLQAATIRCCSDKVRPVLVASTVIPSVNGVIWAGVFSAQNQQDPENSALALYDISNVQGRVKGFCAIGEKPCGSESGTELQPLSVVFRYSSMSAAAAMRIESWIVLFIGTSDGQLIKLMLDEKFTPGCPIVLYKSDDERAVLPRMPFDPVDFKHIYIALKKQLRRVSVVSCAKFSTLKDCRAALDPLCGWCVNTQRCSIQDECTKSSWLFTPKDSLQDLLVSFQVWAEKSSSKITLHLSLSLESTGNPTFSCTFITGSVKLCDGSDLDAVFPNCYCSFSDQLLSTGGWFSVSAVDWCCVLCIQCAHIPHLKQDFIVLSTLQPLYVSKYTIYKYNMTALMAINFIEKFLTISLNAAIACSDVCSDERKYEEPEILSLEPNKVSFHGRNNVSLRGRNLESVTKIRIRGDLECIPKESPVFDRSSDTLRFHIPPSGTKGTVKVCVVTPDDRCHGNSIITYSSQPSCTGIQPTVSWSSGGRKIHVQGSNLEFVESVTVNSSYRHYDLKTQYNTNSGDMWFHSPKCYYYNYECGSLSLHVGNSTVDCGYLSYEHDPLITGFTSLQVAKDLQVNIEKRADMLNLSMNEVTVTGLQGDQQYQCVLEKIKSYSVICKIKGKFGAVPTVDKLNISVGDFYIILSGERPEYLQFFSIVFSLIFLFFFLIFCTLLFIYRI
ncbi:plexin-C1-like [Onychostoma macrolepis]|uniref:plexin-C1-like n=1 Tax=Onychostoma macrolepis TaxID=369639 RepID=UPI00272A4D6C|nr:plexin-C1-like [Onychostoma macrolepis]